MKGNWKQIKALALGAVERLMGGRRPEPQSCQDLTVTDWLLHLSPLLTGIIWGKNAGPILHGAGTELPWYPYYALCFFVGFLPYCIYFARRQVGITPGAVTLFYTLFSLTTLGAAMEYLALFLAGFPFLIRLAPFLIVAGMRVAAGWIFAWAGRNRG